MSMPTAKEMAAVEILLVEDSADDADLMIEALKEGRLGSRITVMDNGEDALAYLRRADSEAPVPDLILLDLFLPRMNGYEVLAAIKQDLVLRRIPIVIMTSSDNEDAILSAYDLHANCCVCKPADQEQFALAVRKIEQFWLRHACRG
jgi:two-component system, chemotaxis family, response regulator Rcp1